MGSTEAKLPGRELSRAVEDLQLRDRHCDEFVGTGPTQPPGHRANGEEKVAQQSPRLFGNLLSYWKAKTISSTPDSGQESSSELEEACKASTKFLHSTEMQSQQRSGVRLQDSGEGRSHRREPEQRLRQDGSERNSESPENEELRKQVKDLQREFESLMSGYNGLQNDRDGLLSRNRHLQKYVKDLQSEVENQKAQIVQYKMEISISTRHGDQVSDDTIRRDAQQIFFAIQNFAARNFRNAQFDYEGLRDTTKAWAEEIIPKARILPSKFCVKMVVSIISRAMMVIFLPQSAFGSLDHRIVRSAEVLASLRPNVYADTRPWIDMTRKLIQHADGAILDNAGETLVHQTVIRVYNELEHAAPIQWTMNMQTALIKIAESCHQLSNLLHCQKARFCVTMLVAVHEDGSPRLFKPDLEEEDFFDGNEEDPHDRTVEMSLFPVIWKLGDEHGENGDTRTIVSKGKVVLREDTHVRYASEEASRRRSSESVIGVHGGPQA